MEPKKTIDIRQVILDRINELGWTRHQTWKKLTKHFSHAPSLYNFLYGEKNISIDKLEAIFEVLGLYIKGRKVRRTGATGARAEPTGVKASTQAPSAPADDRQPE